jgi:hypothetical protein
MDAVEGIVSFNPSVFSSPSRPLEVSLASRPAFALPHHKELIAILIGNGTITMGVAYPVGYAIYPWANHRRKMQEPLAGVIECCPAKLTNEEQMIFISTDLERISYSVPSEVRSECSLLLQRKNK